jgi:hypothetical protein
MEAARSHRGPVNPAVDRASSSGASKDHGPIAGRVDSTRTRAFAPVYEELRKDPLTKAFIAQIERLKEANPPPSAPHPHCNLDTPKPGPTPIDGVYRTSFTREDLVASPLLYDAMEINDDNWGDMTMTFDNGRFSATQKNPTKSGSESGYYTVSGDTVVVTIESGGDVGERFAFRWSLYQGTLTFRRDESLGVGPTPWLIKPWTRVE